MLYIACDTHTHTHTHTHNPSIHMLSSLHLGRSGTGQEIAWFGSVPAEMLVVVETLFSEGLPHCCLSECVLLMLVVC